MDKTKIRFIRTWSFQNSNCLKYTLCGSYFNEALEGEKLTHNSKNSCYTGRVWGLGMIVKLFKGDF